MFIPALVRPLFQLPKLMILVCRTPHAHTHNKQVEEIWVSINVRWCSLDQCQFLQDGVELLCLGKVDPGFLWVSPVRKGHMNSDQVFQMDTQDGKAEAGALWKALSIATVVCTGCDQLPKPLKYLIKYDENCQKLAVLNSQSDQKN